MVCKCASMLVMDSNGLLQNTCSEAAAILINSSWGGQEFRGQLRFFGGDRRLERK